MKYFIDTEFSERGSGHPIELISIGIVAEDGREFYAERRNVDTLDVNPWVRENVFPHLAQFGSDDLASELVPRSMRAIELGIVGFIGDDPYPEFWGYYSDYDWVVFCQIFGDMGNLPEGWPYYCRDLRQELDAEALHHVSQPDDAPHDALMDARWVAETWRSYVSMETHPIEQKKLWEATR